MIYLSLVTVGRDFLSFQWDNLLLEMGLLAIFLDAPRLRTGLVSPRPSPVAYWLLRWLLFRLMFASGVVKLASRDETWWDWTALDFHYETQPLPHWIAWYAHQLPEVVQKASVAVMFAIELVVPFLTFGPRRIRLASCAALVLLQVLIMWTGNYGFFNLLTMLLCLLLIDDAAWPVQDAFRPGPRKLDTVWRWAPVPLALIVAILTPIQLASAFRIRVRPASARPRRVSDGSTPRGRSTATACLRR